MSGGYSGKFAQRDAKFNFLGIIWESKRSRRVNFSGFQRAENSKLRGYGRVAVLNKINQSFDVDVAPTCVFRS